MVTIHPRRAACAIAFLSVSAATAHFSFPDRVPVDRLVRNASAHVAEHPDDGHGYYVLGRIHALAFVLASDSLAVWRERGGAGTLPELAADNFQAGSGLFGREPPPPAPDRGKLRAHLESAIVSYERALGLSSQAEAAQVSGWGVERGEGSAKIHLALGYVLERGSVLAGEADVLPDAAVSEPGPSARAEILVLVQRLGSDRRSVRDEAGDEIRGRLTEAAKILHECRDAEDERVRGAVRSHLAAYWRERAIVHYREAWERAVADDLSVEQQPYFGLTELVSYEAGIGYIALVRARGAADSAESERLMHVERSIDGLESKPPNGIVTPIIFSMDAAAPLRRLLAPGRAVCFDLDGDGDSESWPWVAPGTMILVWDPDGTGQITSGRQLFGSVTWWLFPRDGYHALDLLDDNRDGELTGAELAGIAVWSDRDGDGVSDPGEVIPASGAGVTALGAHAPSTHDGCPANPWGIELADGRVLPTYDWITGPAAGSAEPAPCAARLASR
ncbi:MAG TPA: hypothetical protein VFF69_05085 [Phycisphaerales bacterium]|nr:hypothetical protein [Phycisphaerales bacterium]